MKHTSAASEYVIVGDWGTSSLTLMLCETNSEGTLRVKDTRKGQGAKFCHDFEGHFHSLTNDWFKNHGDIETNLSGMIGSIIGWKDAGYLTCPCSVHDFIEAGFRFTSRGRAINILPGAKCDNSLGLADVMRGEETQIFGYLALTPTKSMLASQLICLPGTHTKWAVVNNGKIQEFLTIPSGELHNLTSKYGIFLDCDASPTEEIDSDLFTEVLSTLKNNDHLNLMTMLFSTRSKRVLGKFSSAQAATYLSAVIVGSDVKSALAVYQAIAHSGTKIPVIGATLNAHLYSKALKLFGFNPEIVPSTDASIAGLAVRRSQNESLK